MVRAIRTQVDTLFDEYSRTVTLDCSDTLERPNPDRARQEHRTEADINWILSQYGIGTPTRPAQYTATDYDMDLQQAIGAVQQAQLVYRKLPEALRNKYHSWQAILTAIAAGKLREDLTEPAPAAEAPAAEAPAAPTT